MAAAIACLVFGGAAVHAGPAAAPVAIDPPAAWGEPVEQGRLQDPDLSESSGLAVGRRNPGVLWTMNDSGHDPFVFAVGLHGEDVASYRVAGVGRGDWEDIATAREGGVPVLVIGDIGDNRDVRPQRLIHIVAEPALAVGARHLRGELGGVRTVHFRYPDGSHDCEALAVDPDARHALLVTKTLFAGATVFVLGLEPGREVRTAQLVGSLPLSMVTAASVSPDGRAVLIGTYTAAYLYRRAADEPWGAALAREPQRVLMPPRPQGEGVAFAADGRSIFAGSEGVHSVLWLIPALPH